MDNNNARVLLVDTDVSARTTLADYLNKEGFETSTPINGNGIIAEALSGSYSLMILNVMLQDLDGFDVLRRLRTTSKLPVILISADEDEIERIIGLEMGADDVVARHCAHREMVARIRAILRRTENHQCHQEHQAITIGAMKLWPQRRTATINDDTLPLTSTEFTLLELLARHAGAIVSKQVLAEAALGRSLSPFDRSIDVHISSIRHKLGGRDDGLAWIQTVRGKGYQFINE